jgi:hypothetical protein
MRFVLPAFLIATSLAACASLSAYNLPRESARAILPTPYPDSVTITEVHHDRLGNVRSWVATTRTGVYDCTIDLAEHHPICAKRDRTP